MRYSMVVYLTKMGRTLLEAAQYLHAASPQDEMRAELLENGRQMLAQMEDVLQQYREDLHSDQLLLQLRKIETLWESGSGDTEEKLQEWIRTLPEEIHYQVRAVFFAELGEKWDAMESVYDYMRNDTRFDPVIVRTPIGRVVNRDGKKEQEIIYKDFLTPMGIPSLGYDEYDIEQDCPELAFTSQPYESCTLEQFWPENIAKYTRLVYLPYFLPGIVLADYPQVLCQLPIYTCAWKVVGSNEKHYKYYRKHSRHGGSNMIVTGVPKIDPILQLQEREISMPSGWETVRGKKKVFLWNTWYNTEASSFCFFDSIFQWFQTHEDCALIWRPHPMTETITKLYTPQQYPSYCQCLEKVKSAPNMILDQEVSFIPSFVYSDAQISDHSSMMHQYMLMDKPLLWFLNLSSSMTGEEFIGCSWMECAKQEQQIISFLERIHQGEDPKALLRKEIIARDLPQADGHCGERVCNSVWEALHSEEHISLR